MIGPTVVVDKFIGLVNRSNSAALGSLTQADNVYLRNDGALIRRDGYTRDYALTNCTSSYFSSVHKCVYTVSSEGLMRHNGVTHEVLDASVPNGRYAWCSGQYAVYLIGNGANRCIEPTRTYSLEIEAPTSFVVSDTGGNLAAGTYQVACTTIDADIGLESAASPITTITLSDGGGIRVVGPATQAVYCSTHDGSVLYYVGKGSDVTLTSEAELSAPLDSLQLGAAGIPDGISCGAFHDGRLYLGQGNFVLFSRPYWPHIFAPHEDFVQLPSEVVAMERVQGGLVIGCERTIHFYGWDGSLRTLADYGVVPGRPMAIDQNEKVWMWTPCGLCSFDGQFTEVQKAIYAPNPGSQCCLSITDLHGDARIVVLTDGAGAPLLSSY